MSMTILEVLQKAAGVEKELVALLQKAAAASPDLAPEVADVIAKLEAAVDPANLAALGSAIPGELLNIAQGHLDPRTHAGDGA